MEENSSLPGPSCECENDDNVQQDMIQSNSQELTFSSGCSECDKLKELLKEEEKRCNVLRANIHKVSANWFHRKSQLSESEMEHESSPVNLLDETTRVDEENNEDGIANSRSKEGSPSGLSRDVSRLVNIIAQKSAQLDLADTHCRDLKKKMREYEKIIDDKESIVHGLKEQLDTYLNDNQKMSSQLNHLASLFQQLEKVEKEAVATPEVPIADTESATAVPLPDQEEYSEMANSVSRTYIKLKDLIYEKKALVTEIERLNTLNVELQRRVLTQENRLISVSDALHQTWLVVSNLKEQHAKLHEDELVYKYELREKREILTKLRNELESSREKWQIIRQKNLESELEYASIRQMLRERRQALNEGEAVPEVEKEEEELDEAVCMHPDDASFDPPVDLLLEMGIEYGIIGEGAEMTQTVLDVIRGEDIRTNRLEQLEEHCSLLYSKLIQSTSRSLSLASRLTRLHDHFGSSDDEDEFAEIEDDDDDEDVEDEHDDEEEEAPYITDANHLAAIESVLSSPESEEYDTAYVSETDAENQIENFVTTATINLPSVNEASTSYAPDINTNPIPEEDEELEENCDQLSKTLINYLPKKIEYLREQNGHLENNLTSLKEEKASADIIAKKMEKENLKLQEEMKILTKEMTIEKLQKRQLEEQLKHLGKCVDELKLKHDDEKKSPKSKKSEDESEQEESNNDSTRSEEEKRKETDKLKREVELVKKEMELKRKEKDLRKREQDLEKKETTSDKINSEDKKESCDTELNKANEKSSLVTSSEFSSISSIIDLREVISSIVYPKKQSVIENKIPAENGATVYSSVTVEETNNTELNQRLQRYNLMPVQEMELIEMVKRSAKLVEDGVFILPVRLKRENELVICSFWPSKDASLLVLQVTTPKVEEPPFSAPQPSTSTSNDESGTQLQSNDNASNNDNFNCTVLVPSSRLPPNVESSVTLKAKCPILCIVVLRQIKKEDLEVIYSISTKENE